MLCATFAALAVVFGLVNALFGHDDGGRTSVSASADDSVMSVPSESVPPGQTATAEATSTAIQVTVATKEHPAELLVLGDSDAGNYGPAVRDLLDATGVVVTTIDYHIAAGLARPDYFDWPLYMRQVVPQVNPDIVVVTFGGNDAQGLRNADGRWAVGHRPGEGLDDTTWRAEYGRRVGETMDSLTEGARTLIWVGITNDDETQNTARLKVQDEVVRAEVAKRPRVVFVDSWAMFSGVDGGWASSIIDPRDGVGKDVRRADGFHLNETGADILAWKIEQIVLDDLRSRGAQI